MFLCDSIYLKQNTPKNFVFLQKMLHCKSQTAFLLKQKKIGKTYELLKNFLTAFYNNLLDCHKFLNLGQIWGIRDICIYSFHIVSHYVLEA